VFPIYLIPLLARELRPDILEVGTDVSDLLGITKYERPETAPGISGDPKGTFPSGIISKTDETRLQSCTSLLDELDGEMVYVTQKVDGTSATYVLEGVEFMVCSRNMQMKDGNNVYWEMAGKNKIEDALREYADANLCFDFEGRPITGGVAVQGEIAGPGIQGNPMGLQDREFFVFNVKILSQGRYMGLHEMRTFCVDSGLRMVPVSGVFKYQMDIDGGLDFWLTMADCVYPNGKPAEGIVVRTLAPKYSPKLGKPLSFKVISNRYLLKEK
jgi:RNA ligase (TIGR02306 family)